KYIIFEDFAGEATPIIFPERIAFEEMREQIPYTKVLSGGIISLKQGQIECLSQANELGLKALDKDNLVILEHLL
ncbi:MAG: hypothetical protein ACLFT1_09345, partial [Desulfonatronovibrio sp.]